jgi:hypothetical protein
MIISHFKCRLCFKHFVKRIPEFDGHPQMSDPMGRVCAAIHGEIQPALIETHQCEPNQVGVADLIGVEKDE